MATGPKEKNSVKKQVRDSLKQERNDVWMVLNCKTKTPDVGGKEGKGSHQLI